MTLTVQSFVLYGLEITANANPPNSTTQASKSQLEDKDQRKPAGKTKGQDLLALLDTESLVKIFSLIQTNPSAQTHMIPRTYLTNMRAVCKRVKSVIDEYMPEETFHLLLAKNSPSRVLELFESKPSIKHRFEKVVGEYIATSFTASKNDDDEIDANEEKWDGDCLSDEYIHLALEHCQKNVVKHFVDSKVVSKDDVEFHIAVVTSEDPRMFLALKSRTRSYQYNDRDDDDSGSSQDIDIRPISPHAQWLGARILAFLSSNRLDMKALNRRPYGDVQGWTLWARPRGDGVAALRWQFVNGFSIG